MRATIRRGAAITLTSLVLGGGLLACGSSNDNAGSGTPVWPGVGGTTAAADSGGSTGSGGTDSGSGSAPAAGSSVSVGAFTAKMQHAVAITSTAHMAMTVGAAGRTIDAQGDIQMKPLAEDLTMSMMGMDIEVRVVDDTFYMKVPMPSAGGDTWIKATADELGSASGLGNLSSLTDPLSMVVKVGDAMKSATYVGTDSTGQHYQVSVDTGKLVKAMGLSGSQLSQLGSQMPATVTEDVWFDSAGHIVATKSDLGSTSTSTHLSDFGKQVDVTAPPAAQVRDLGSLGGLSGLSGL